jgi:hypothetical protein
VVVIVGVVVRLVGLGEVVLLLRPGIFIRGQKTQEDLQLAVVSTLVIPYDSDPLRQYRGRQPAHGASTGFLTVSTAGHEPAARKSNSLRLTRGTDGSDHGDERAAGSRPAVLT